MSKRLRSSTRSGSGRSSNKRQANETVTASIPCPSFSNPKKLAATLLEMLPNDATMNTKESQNLFKAMDLVSAELQHRTNLMSQSSLQTGKQTDVVLSKVTIPQDVFRQVLSFLPTTHMVNQAALVSKTWLAATRTPQLWDTLDHERGLMLESRSITNMTALLELLERPQFASLKVLVPPEKVQLRAKALAQIARSCPLLETIHFGYSLWSSMKIDDKQLFQVPSFFPHLSHVALGTDRITDAGLAAFCDKMGDRLLTLRINDSCACYKKMSDQTLVHSIARHNGNLKVFDFCFSPHYNARVNADFDNTFTEKGVMALLDGCPKLQHLSLIHTDSSVGKKAFQHIVENNETAVSLNRLYVVGHDDLMEDTVLCNALDEKIRRFESVTRTSHNQYISRKRITHQIHYNW